MITAIVTPIKGGKWLASVKDGDDIRRLEVQSKDPECDLCRLLQEEGHTGTINFVTAHGTPSLTGKVEWFDSKRAVDGSPVFRDYEEKTDD